MYCNSTFCQKSIPIYCSDVVVYRNIFYRFAIYIYILYIPDRSRRRGLAQSPNSNLHETLLSRGALRPFCISRRFSTRHALLLVLAPRQHTVSEFADNVSNALTVSFSIRPPSFPSRGPFPRDVVPMLSPAFPDDISAEPIPKILPSCSRTTPPVITGLVIGPSIFHPVDLQSTSTSIGVPLLYASACCSMSRLLTRTDPSREGTFQSQRRQFPEQAIPVSAD